MKTRLILGIVGFVLASVSGSPLGVTANAEPVPIIGYDVAQTHPSGFGCWFHDYAGVIVDTGRTDSQSVGCSPDANRIVDYTGGSGTLNDGVISTTTGATHLFVIRSDDQGVPITPVLTLHLGGTFPIKAIRLYGGDIDFNVLPGALTGATVEIGGVSVALTTNPFGTPTSVGIVPNDELDLTGTVLAGVSTDRIVLRDFTAELFGFSFDQFAITEIVVEGAPAFAGTPETAGCHGASVSALATEFGGLAEAAASLGFASVQALHDAIGAHCQE